MNHPWKYIFDQMEVETARNVKKAMILSRYHNSALNTMSAFIPGLMPLYIRYNLVHLAFEDGYSTLESVDGGKQGDKISVEEMLVSTKVLLVDNWLPAILVLYPKHSARYKALFPKGLYSFNTKGIDARIAAYHRITKNILYSQLFYVNPLSVTKYLPKFSSLITYTTGFY